MLSRPQTEAQPVRWPRGGPESDRAVRIQMTRAEAQRQLDEMQRLRLVTPASVVAWYYVFADRLPSLRPDSSQQDLFEAYALWKTLGKQGRVPPIPVDCEIDPRLLGERFDSRSVPQARNPSASKGQNRITGSGYQEKVEQSGSAGDATERQPRTLAILISGLGFGALTHIQTGHWLVTVYVGVIMAGFAFLTTFVVPFRKPIPLILGVLGLVVLWAWIGSCGECTASLRAGGVCF